MTAAVATVDLPERAAWVAIAAVPGIGEVRFERLVAAFGSARGALRALGGPDASIRHALAGDAGGGVPRDLIVALRAVAEDPLAVDRRVAALGGWTLTPLDEGYPPLLRLVEHPPAVLFGIGDGEVLAAVPAVAVVGTRRPTPGGRALAGRVAVRLCEHGAVVVSGLAFGIDGAAHTATCDAGGRTVAVVGGGLEHAGPRAHHRLLDRIVTGGGAVIAEHAPDVPPTRGTFPRRNRIISGMSRAVIIIEAPARSGALITARHALEQGRSVFAAPGRVGDPSVAGCLALLRETPARVLAGLDELVADLELGDIPPADAGTAERAATGVAGDDRWAAASLSAAERAVARRIQVGPATVDAIVATTGLRAGVVSGAVTLLAMRGWIQPVGALLLPAGPLLRQRAGSAVERGQGVSGAPRAG